jgi:hypothetical protein
MLAVAAKVVASDHDDDDESTKVEEFEKCR